MGSDPEPEFIFSETRWVHGGGAAPHLATDGLPPTPLPRPRHLCAVRGCDRPQVPGMRGRWRSRTALGRGGARGGVSSHLPRGSVEPRCSRMGSEDVLWGGQNPSSARNHRMYRLPACVGNAELPGPARFGEVLGYFRVVPRYAAAAQISGWAAPWAGSWGVR
jgi:hypothetical protein